MIAARERLQYFVQRAQNCKQEEEGRAVEAGGQTMRDNLGCSSTGWVRSARAKEHLVTVRASTTFVE